MRRHQTFLYWGLSRSIQQHLLLLPSGQVGEAFGRSGVPECKKAVAIETRKSNEGLFQLLAAHALDRIASGAVPTSQQDVIERADLFQPVSLQCPQPVIGRAAGAIVESFRFDTIPSSPSLPLRR